MLWLILEEDGGSLNVTAGNYLGMASTFGINISGDYQDIQVGAGSTNSSLFTVSGYNYTATLDTGSVSLVAMFPFNKTSLLCSVTLTRDDDIVRQYIVA